MGAIDVLLSGASGQLGFELQRRLKARGASFLALDRSDWDVTQPEQTRKLLSQHTPRVVINCAAYTAVDRAEQEAELARSINGEAPPAVFEACRSHGALFVHISTDFVFGSGRPPGGAFWQPEDPAEPRGVYAKTKREGELALLQAAGPERGGLALVRTSWVYSVHGANFPRTILRLLGDAARPELRVIEDQVGRPTNALRLAEWLDHFLIQRTDSEAGLPGGVYHFANSGVCSWYDFACAIQEEALQAGLLKHSKPIHPIPTEAYPTPAPRPRFSVLDLTSAREILPEIPHWRDDLRIFMQELKQSGASA